MLHAYRIEDVRAALQWSLSKGGDIRLGVALAGASAPLWFALSRMAEYLGVVECFIERLDDAGPLEPRREFALYESVGHALWNIRGASSAAISAFQKALHAAERANAVPDQMRALWGLWLVGHSDGDYPLTLHRAERFGALASLSKDPANEVAHHRMMTLSTHSIGRHAQARRHAQAVLDRPLSADSAARNSSYHFDQRTTALMTMARILWVHGFPDQALAHAERAIERALSINHSLSLCFALSVGCCPVAFWSGNLERAQNYTHLLQSRSKEYSLTLWSNYGEGYGRALGLLRGELRAVDLPSEWPNLLRDMLCTVHPDLADEASLERGLAGTVAWSGPELLRVRAARARRADNVKAAERLLNEGLNLAAEHEALSWSLRCAMDLADLLHTSKSAKAARSVLAPVYESFSEGWATADLKAAAAMLESLA